MEEDCLSGSCQEVLEAIEHESINKFSLKKYSSLDRSNTLRAEARRLLLVDCYLSTATCRLLLVDC